MLYLFPLIVFALHSHDFNPHFGYSLNIAGPFICPQGELESLLPNFFFLGELTKHVKTSMMIVMSRYT